MMRTLLALPLALFCVYSCQAKSRDLPQNNTTVQLGDILIAGKSDEEGISIGVEAPDDVELEPLYGRIQLLNNRQSAEKVLAALIIVPPKGA